MATAPGRRSDPRHPTAAGRPAPYTARMSEPLPLDDDADGRETSPTAGIDHACLQHLLGYQIARADIPTRRAFSHHIGKPLNLTAVEFSTLVLLAHNTGATPKQLADALAMHAPAVSVLLDRLAQRGLLERVRSETDRRLQHVLLTAEGRQLADEARERSLTAERALLQGLSAAERAILVELLQKVAGARGV